MKKSKDSKNISITEKEREKGRSENYHQLSPREQWEEDKQSGTLDWNGE